MTIVGFRKKIILRVWKIKIYDNSPVLEHDIDHLSMPRVHFALVPTAFELQLFFKILFYYFLNLQSKKNLQCPLPVELKT